MPTYTSSQALVNNGDIITHTPAAGITVTAARVRWKGKSTTSQQATAKTVGASGVYSCTIPIGEGEWMISGTATCWISDPDPPGGTWYWGSTPQGTIYPGQTKTKSYSMTNPTAGNYMGCTVLVHRGVSASATVGYYVTVELKTDDCVVTVNGQSASYTNPINDGTWTDYISLDVSAFTPGTEMSLDLDIGGSATGYIQYEYDFTYNRPTQLKTMKVQQGSTIIVLPLVSPTDPALEYACLRAQLGSTVYCVDVVDTTDSEASPGRFMKGTTIYAVRKVV